MHAIAIHDPCRSSAAARECSGSFSSVSNTVEAMEEDQFHLLHQQNLPYHSKLLLGSPPEMAGNVDDSDLRCITRLAPSEPPPAPKKKKKRSLPGTPDPSSEVIALSPKTLMATNRFVCEICHKGFQRDQNLQLHRRGHNLPWKLRQRAVDGSAAPPRKRVYVCPEASCVHHSPTRALGDLTGIKKHFCRKHGEKKWKCDRCGKRYAVHSDWKAHAKVCGTREYTCDCGTVFSRRDSFVTHRAFCDALAIDTTTTTNHLPMQHNMATVASALQGQASSHHLVMPSSHGEAYVDAENEDDSVYDTKNPLLSMAGCMLSSLGGRPTPAPSPYFHGSKPGPLCLDVPNDPAMAFSPGASSAGMSATALLQKAAEMGATTTIGFTSVGLGPMMGSGLDRFSTPSPFGPTRGYGLNDALPSAQTQLVGFDVGVLLPGQLYGGGDSSMTRAIGSMMHGGGGGDHVMVHRRADGVRFDFMGVDDVDDHRSFDGVSHSGPNMGPWA